MTINNTFLQGNSTIEEIVAQACVNLEIPDSGQIIQSVRKSLLQNLAIFENLPISDPILLAKLRREVCLLANFRYQETLPIDDQQFDALSTKVSAIEAEKAGLVPVRIEKAGGSSSFDIITFATSEPFNGRFTQSINRSNYGIRHVVAEPSEIAKAREQLYGIGGQTVEGIVSAKSFELSELNDEINLLEGEDDEATVVRFVNQLIIQALEIESSDIHIEPLEQDLQVRFRIDGQLVRQRVPARINELKSALLSRIKVMAGLDIGEKRLPQDGRINLGLRGERLDVRVATIPGVHGESISLRLLRNENFTLKDLELLDREKQLVEKLIQLPNGIILVTGPTGSGKSTTLYSFLKSLDTEKLRIVTIEDPVENKLEGIHQIHVNSEIGLTFAKGLRSILRGDPNVVMVGEIRDEETAEIALRAALTGHLVLSTLHTNDALGAIERLTDMGMEPFFVGAALKGVIGQRLVRKRCQKCKGDAQKRVRCQVCKGSGYKGRVAIFEVSDISDPVKELIEKNESKSQIIKQAEKEGFRTMREYGMILAEKGITSQEEVLGSTMM